MSNRLTIPQVREGLLELAEKIEADQEHDGWAWDIRYFVKQMHRRSPEKRGGRERRPAPDPEVVRVTALQNPGWTHAQIATLLETNPGRVSEALNGKR